MKEKRKKKTLLLVALLIFVAVLVGIACYLRYQAVSTPRSYVDFPVGSTENFPEKLAWRHDLKPLQDIFGSIEGMERCYWQKAASNSSSRSYEAYRGFIVLKRADLKKLEVEYRWEKTGGDLLSEIASKATGYHDFKWADNQDFVNKVMPSGFRGGLCLDLKNGIIFFYLEGNSGGASSSATKSQNSGNATAKKSISSTSLLTNESIGKGVISLGDSVGKVKQTFAGYSTDDGSSIDQDFKNQYGESFWFGTAGYSFDTSGKLLGCGSASGFGSFETSKGLKIGDSLSRVFELYGKNYSFNDGGSENLPSYMFSLEKTNLMVIVSASSNKEKDMSATVNEMGFSAKR
ncbi:MAG: hypothetical protein FWD65_03080 [Coriobacteriia bacterium]|nr:hypothetical protein [Coriobacteriia bacterium]